MLLIQLKAKEQGFADVVYLDAQTNTYLEEVSIPLYTQVLMPCVSLPESTSSGHAKRFVHSVGMHTVNYRHALILDAACRFLAATSLLSVVTQ